MQQVRRQQQIDILFSSWAGRESFVSWWSEGLHAFRQTEPNLLLSPHIIWLSSSEIRHRVLPQPLPQPLLVAGKTMDREWIHAFKGRVPNLSHAAHRAHCCAALFWVFSAFLLSPMNMAVDWKSDLLRCDKPLWPVRSSDACESTNVSTLRTTVTAFTLQWPLTTYTMTISTVMLIRKMKGRVLSFGGSLCSVGTQMLRLRSGESWWICCGWILKQYDDVRCSAAGGSFKKDL